MHLGEGGIEEQKKRGGERNRRVKDKIRGERAWTEKDGQECGERGQEVSKTVAISRQNTSPKKDMHTHTDVAPQ